MTAALLDLMAMDAYRRVLDRVVPTGNLDLRPEDDQTRMILFSYLEKDLRSAGVVAAELAETLEVKADSFGGYVLAKLTKYDGLEVEEEYSPGEEPDRDDDPSDVEDSWFDETFLLGHLIEFAVLDRGLDLRAFLKAQKMPGAARYAQEITAMYTQALADA